MAEHSAASARLAVVQPHPDPVVRETATAGSPGYCVQFSLFVPPSSTPIIGSSIVCALRQFHVLTRRPCLSPLQRSDLPPSTRGFGATSPRPPSSRPHPRLPSRGRTLTSGAGHAPAPAGAERSERGMAARFYQPLCRGRVSGGVVPARLCFNPQAACGERELRPRRSHHQHPSLVPEIVCPLGRLPACNLDAYDHVPQYHVVVHREGQHIRLLVHTSPLAVEVADEGAVAQRERELGLELGLGEQSHTVAL
eukprot:scaffold18185_cov106-Isochrysis_galbana.AAC.2